MKNEPNSLGFVSIDDAMFAFEIEDRFEIAFSESDWSKWSPDLTLGDITDVVLQKLEARDGASNVCLSMAAFYRLRHALREMGHPSRISPKADLRMMLAANIRDQWKQLQRSSGLDLPSLEWHPIYARAYTTLCAISLPLAIIYIGNTIPILVGGAVLLAFGASIPVRLPEQYSKLSALSKEAVHRNIGALSREYRVVRPDDVWNALVAIARQHSSGPDDMRITRETRLYR